MSLIDKYLEYIANIRRYSVRTQELYAGVLDVFIQFAFNSTKTLNDISDDEIKEALTSDLIRGYEMYLLEDRGLKARTVNLHISVLSGFCRFLMGRKEISSNPAKAIKRPKMEKRLPEFYKHDALKRYFADSEVFAGPMTTACPEEFIEYYKEMRDDAGYSQERDTTLALLESMSDKPDKFSTWLYDKRLRRAIVSTLYSTGIRRAELISLTVGSIDFSRRVMRVHGKGDKTREIPVVPSLCKEISLYLQAVETISCEERRPDSPLFVTNHGNRLYPSFVDRAVKSELGETGNFTGRKSPHVLRHTLATELLDEGTDLNSIKELLGHSSLAATQVYTHNSIAKLKKVYETAHPRAKSGGNHGD